MGEARLRLHGDLADFTRPANGAHAAGRDVVEVTARFEGAPGLKDVIESTGVPHCEVDGVQVDGAPATLESKVCEGAEVDVFPRGEGPAQLPRLLPPPQPTPRFVLDGHLGRLASLLRLLGFDVAWERDPADAALADTSAREDRTLLTRDLGLLKRAVVRRGAFVRATRPQAQAKEVVQRFHLRDAARPFTRCLTCNGRLAEVSPEAAAPRVPPRVRERQTRFLECDGCGALYWPGTHHARLERTVAALLADA